jgi:tape measure domain-containing protein
MATDLERLVVQLSADVRSFQTDLAKANGIAGRQARAIENRFRTMNRNVDKLMSSTARGLVAPLTGIAAALSVREVLQYADAWTKAKNSLAVAGVTGRQQKQVMDALFASAQRNAAPIGVLTSLYGKAALSAKVLGASQDDLIRFSDGIAVALRASGTSTEAASGALTQLGQALGAGTVRAEEFNSILEGAPAIAQSVANGLDGVGGDIGKLRQKMLDGGLASRDFFNAFLKGLPAVQSLADNAAQTIEQGITKVNNAFTKYIGQSDESLGASQRLVAALNLLADNFNQAADYTLMFAGIIAGALVGRSLVAMIAKLALATTGVIRLVAALRAASSISGVAAAFGGLGAAAGPIGAIVGVAAAVAVQHFAGAALEASARTDELKSEMEQLGISADGATTALGATAKAIAELAPEEARRRLQNIREELDRLNGKSWSGILFGNIDTLGDIDSRLNGLRRPARGRTNGAAERAAADELTIILSMAKAGAISAEEMNRRLDEIAKKKVSQPIDDLIAKMRELIPYYRQTIGYQDQLLRRGDGAPIITPNRRAGIAADRATLAANIAAGKTGLADASKEAGMSTAEKRLADEMDRLRKAIEKQPGAIVTESQLRAQAQKNLAAGDANAVIEGYVDRVKKAEGSGRNPNSSAEGVGQFIESTWLDLFRRYFPDRAKGLSDAAILALRSDEASAERLIDAYARENAAVLQKAGVSVTEAALQLSHFLGAGDAAKVLKAAPGTPLKGLISDASIAANPTVLGGGRTVDDAIAYAQNRAGQSTAGAERFGSNEDFDTYLKQQQATAAGMREEIELRRQLGSETISNTAAYAAFQRASELLADAQSAGAAVAVEVHDVNTLLHGDLSKLTPAAREQAEAMRALAQQYGLTAEAGAALDAGQQQVGDKLDGLNEIGRSALGTVISDLRQGKDAAEALADALDQVADRLINIALDAAFPTSGGNGGGGWVGAVISALTGGLGAPGAGGVYAEGGWTGPGGKYKPAGVVHAGEYVFDAESTRKIGVGNLDAMRRRLKGYAGGGFVGVPSIPRRAAAAPAATSMVIDVRGATGNAEVQSMVAAGVRQGVAAYDRQMADGRIIRQRLGNAQLRFR